MPINTEREPRGLPTWWRRRPAEAVHGEPRPEPDRKSSTWHRTELPRACSRWVNCRARWRSATDSSTLYVANSGGESISIVNLDKGAVVGSVQFPQLPFNTTIAPITAQVIASSERGPQVIMSDGTLWKISGGSITCSPFRIQRTFFGTAKAVASRRSPWRRAPTAASSCCWRETARGTCTMPRRTCTSAPGR